MLAQSQGIHFVKWLPTVDFTMLCFGLWASTTAGVRVSDLVLG